MISPDKRGLLVLVLTLFMTIGVFLLDLVIPRGMGVWQLYLLPVVAAYWSPRRIQPLLLAAIITLLLGLGFFFAPPGIPDALALFTRILGTVALWAAAGLLYQRGQTEQALRESEEQARHQLEELEQLYRSAPVGLAFVDTNLRYVRINDRLAAINGRPASDHVGRSLREVVPDIADVIEPIYRQVISTGQPVLNWEIHGTTPAEPSVQRDFLANYYPLKASSGGTRGVNVVIQEITQRKRTEAKLKATLEQLRALTGHLESVREDERARMAREIHDELGQALTGLKMDVSWIKNHLPPEGGERSQALKEKAEGMSALIDATIQTVRRLASELHPGILDDLGLAAALEWQAREFEKRFGIPCTLDLEELALDADRSIALFRICQEALTNIARHASAHAVRIRLQTEGGDLTLEIEDNGQGIPEQALSQNRSFGLLGMRERAAMVRGELQVRSQPGDGTRITARIPLSPSPLAGEGWGGGKRRLGVTFPPPQPSPARGEGVKRNPAPPGGVHS